MEETAKIDNFYDNLEEAQFRLKNTVVDYDGRPYYITSVEEHADGVMRVKMYPLPMAKEGTNEPVRKKINSPHFKKFRPIKIGYVNHFKKSGYQHCYFAERIPLRRSKQGLSQDAMKAHDVNGTSLGFTEAIYHQSFVDCTTGVYPTAAEAYGALVKDSSIAISREFCLAKDAEGYVWFNWKNKKIGIYVRGTLFINPEYAYLKETIEADKNLPQQFEIGV